MQPYVKRVALGSPDHNELMKRHYLCSSCGASIDENDPAFENGMCSSCFKEELTQESIAE